jgi:hypothetical protein
VEYPYELGTGRFESVQVSLVPSPRKYNGERTGKHDPEPNRLRSLSPFQAWPNHTGAAVFLERLNIFTRTGRKQVSAQSL